MSRFSWSVVQLIIAVLDLIGKVQLCVSLVVVRAVLVLFLDTGCL